MFVIIDLIFLFCFVVFVVAFLYKNRKRIDREGILFLYRTKLGIRLIDKASKHKRLLNVVGYFSLVFGYIFMALAIFLLILSLVQFVKTSINIPPVAPLVPYFPTLFNIPGLPPLYFTYWLIIILIIAVSHEFAHGILARKEGLRIKSTGFGFLGPFIAAFVEPDEKAMQKKKIKQQLAILSAGSFANFLVAILFIIITQAFFIAAYNVIGLTGYMFAMEKVNVSEIQNISLNITYANETNETTAYVFYSFSDFLNFLNNSNKTKTNFTFNAVLSLKNQSYFLDSQLFSLQEELIKQGSIYAYIDSPAYKANVTGAIVSVDGKKVKSFDEMMAMINQKKPGDVVKIETIKNGTKEEYEITLASHPKNASRPFIGISYFKLGTLTKFLLSLSPASNPFLLKEPKHKAADFFKDLFYWIVLIGISVALFNMLPFSILDGGRVSYLTFLWIFKNKKKAEKAYRAFSTLILIVFLAMLVVWLFRI
jgi:membrane-associated protease RseP (regulator of RpoE activity)